MPRRAKVVKRELLPDPRYQSVLVTRIVYWIEDAFDHLPVHWM